jgi:hypothetical protein
LARFESVQLNKNRYFSQKQGYKNGHHAIWQLDGIRLSVRKREDLRSTLIGHNLECSSAQVFREVLTSFKSV